MEYTIYLIDNQTQLERCPVFYVEHFNWGGDYRPKAFGRMAWLRDTGFLLRMTCMEPDPVCHYVNDNDPVYLDSAMEAFLALCPSSDYYFNFEFNAKGALLAKYGNGRHGRVFFTKEQLDAIRRQVSVGSDRWEILLLVPVDVLTEYFPDFHAGSETRIRLNFFKIAEGKERTHFASYAPIDSPKPDFHLPQFFADGLFRELP